MPCLVQRVSIGSHPQEFEISPAWITVITIQSLVFLMSLVVVSRPVHIWVASGAKDREHSFEPYVSLAVKSSFPLLFAHCTPAHATFLLHSKACATTYIPPIIILILLPHTPYYSFNITPYYSFKFTPYYSFNIIDPD